MEDLITYLSLKQTIIYLYFNFMFVQFYLCLQKYIIQPSNSEYILYMPGPGMFLECLFYKEYLNYFPNFAEPSCL